MDFLMLLYFPCHHYFQRFRKVPQIYIRYKTNCTLHLFVYKFEALRIQA